MKFVNLHAHTVFSIGDGLNYPKDHFDFVLGNAESDSMGMAITDHGNCNSFGYAFQAQQSLRKKGVNFKFVAGCEFYYHPSLDNWQKIYDAKKSGDIDSLDEGLVIEIENESKGKYYDPIKRRHHLVVFAYNAIGLRNLYKLVSRAHRFGFYRYPRIDNAMLDECKEGLVISTACLAGIPSWSILREERSLEDHFKVLDEEVKPLLDIFPKDHAHLEIQFNKLDEQKTINDVIIPYALDRGYKLLATADSHYCNPDLWKDRELYRMLAWQTKGMGVSKEDLPASRDDLKCELFPKNGQEMFDEYSKIYSGERTEQLDQIVKDAIYRGWDLAHNLCEDVSPDASLKLPVKNLEGRHATTFDLLKELCETSLEDKGLADNPEYIARLKTELRVIKLKNFSDYFITLHDAMTEIKKHQLSSPGRGSGCGSLALYLLDITQLDPIKNDLLFERFLSEYRDEPPDVDLDSDDRVKSLQILKDFFGESEVIPITNFNTLQLKSLVKDISKFYEVPFSEVNAVTTVMETEARQKILDELGGDQKLYDFTFDAALKHSPTFRNFIEENPDIGQHIKALYRQIKSIGKHAGGVAITNCSEEAMPVIRVRGDYQTPWSEGLTAKHLEPSGIIKYDFLAIATLGFIRRCIESILEKKLGRDPTFDEINSFYTSNLHPDVVGNGEADVFEEVYQKGRFPGIFQFTQDNARKFCVDAKPEKVMDLAAITSIYRPGPIEGGVPDKYVEAVHNPELVSYDHPILQEVLGDTFGYIVYQEQFMLLAHKLADFTLEESNTLRKLLVKPITSMGEEMKKKRAEAGEKFVEGAISKGLDPERANRLWDKEIMGFISYGFNKSHALAYSYVSYQCAWLFHHFPDHWACAFLEKDPDRDSAIKDVESVGYTIGKPDILSSSKNWTVESRVLYPSFQTLKGFGEIAVEELLEIRSTWEKPEFTMDDGADLRKYDLKVYESFFYRLEEVQLKKSVKIKKKWKFGKFNKKSLEALIRVEALDSLGFVGPGRLFENYAHMHRCVMGNWSKRNQVKYDLLAITEQESKEPWSDDEKIIAQLEVLGSFDSDLVFTTNEIAQLESIDVYPIGIIDEVPKDYWFILTGWDVKTTNSGKKYHSLHISDIEGSTEKLNYFTPIRDGDLRKMGIYACSLFKNKGWVNVPKGKYLEKIR